MKCILTAILLFFTVIGKAQVSYLDSTYSWTEWFTISDYTIRFKLEFEPTLFNGKNYHEVLKSYREEGEDWIHTGEYIRNEPPRIYWLHGTEENVLYDFSLNVGDEFEYPYGQKETLRVTKKDTLTLQNGEQRKLLRLTCEVPYDTAFWVEGLPSLRGLFEDMVCEPGFGENPFVMCLHRNDTLLYRLPFVDSCFRRQFQPVPFLDDRYEWTEYSISAWSTHRFTTRYTFDPTPLHDAGLAFYERLKSDEPFGENWEHTHMYYGSDENNRVYLSYFDNIYMVYDYNLSVNDTFEETLIVDQIDSITLANGEKHKQLRLRCVWDEDPPITFGYTYWIEGLGGRHGVYGPGGAYECNFDVDGIDMLCMSRNDTLLFDHPDYDSCWYLATATENPFKPTIQVYPNPTSGKLTIGSSAAISEISVFDVTGQFLFSKQEKEFDLTPLPSGMYFFRIPVEHQGILYRRVIKL